MVKTLRQQQSELDTPNALDRLSAGEYARKVIANQFRDTIAQEDGVVADKDPEYLHQMRVGSRRLGSALLAFERVVKLPKPACERRVRSLTKTLGQLRDLDVQIASIQTDYSPRVNAKERKALSQTLDRLRRQRERALAQVRQTLRGTRYQKLKDAYETWLLRPHFKPLATLPLKTLLPELLNPLLCVLLLHPGWLVAVDDVSGAQAEMLHDLRKACKYVRYQAEIFSEFYDKAFLYWIRELKHLQDHLGDVQDCRVLQDIVLKRVSKQATLPELEAAIQSNRNAAMGDWERIRHQYLDPEYRDRLHRMTLAPAGSFKRGEQES